MKRSSSNALLGFLYVLMAPLAGLLRVVRWQRGLIDRHVERCLPEAPPARRREVERGFYRYLGELAAEILYERFLDREALASRVRFENAADVDDLLRQQRRVLILSAHHANWEWLLLRCSTGFEAPLTAVYKRLGNARLERFVRKLRERFGCSMIGTRQLVGHLMARRGQVPLLAMLADQSPGKKNAQQVWMDFFGQPTSFHGGPGLIGSKFGYRAFFAAMRRESRGRYVVTLVPLAADVARPRPEDILQAYVGALEQHVRAYPEQYFWAYNRWKREKPLYG